MIRQQRKHQPNTKESAKEEAKQKLVKQTKNYGASIVNPEDSEQTQSSFVVQSSPFVEKHMVESLDVEPECPLVQVLYYHLLN